MSQPRLVRRRTAALMCAAALVVACTDDGDGTATTSTAAPTTSSPTSESTTIPDASTTTGAPTTTEGTSEDARPGPGLRRVDPFAAYEWVPLLTGDTPYAGPPTPTSIDDVLLVESQQSLLDADELVSRIEANGFAVEASTWRYFHPLYKAESYEYMPLFVTTDAMYHSWHLAFDKALRDVEQDHLLPILERLLTAAVPAARAQQEQLAGSALETDAERATAYYEAAAELLGLDLGTTSDRAAQEVELAQQAAGVTRSPVSGVSDCQFPRKFDGCVDYSLFLPRGHYTRTPELKRYFAGMSLLGQEFFGLGDTADAVVPGLLVTRVLASDPALLDDWSAIYEPTAFLVGLADDITPLEVAVVADDLAPGWRDDPGSLTDLDTGTLADELIAAHPTIIDPERAGIRLMGARFTLDSFVLDQLAWPNVGTEAEPRVDVSALDVAAALGSELARSTQLDAGEGVFDHYESQLDAMRSLVDDRRPDDWAGTVYDAWLAALQPSLAPRNAAYPDFMRTPAWEAKSMQTALASYTELKHDTVLYAKQGSAGEGEGPQPPPFTPRNWVEPDPVAFGRLAGAAALLRDGMQDRSLLSDADADLLDTIVELSTWLGGIATRELAGQVATDDENARLGEIGSELEYIWFASADTSSVEGQPVADGNDSDAVVADIFRSSFDYLEVGTGAVDTIYVVVPLGDGRFELAVGGVSSYYEFRRPTTELRLTDEEWKSMIDQWPIPVERPSWQAPFLVGAQTADVPVPNQDLG
ncbi:MAG: DUF3160 domain-containing protein [Actinobacteria bacterium]|nr:DUF3160 domain-containing protein [Actinomycetota bacterium]